ncbi:MAG: sigma 54-interacting transcriptional regulator [Desulfotignum sp.]|nr:sigma 54-interacting transcriptional regulator [Desulfotignum sp.]MCF8113296.1 sigma 54-interacting transcriptional regulator [Desulfotignum sp.]MCF8125052.1 sigma 54-interacting transcriptional regulator [Desulfotignum sp.]
MKTHELWNVHFLNQIIDTMAEGLFTLDDQGIITSWNQAMEKISGFSALEAVGSRCDILKCSRCYGKQCPADINACGVMVHGRTEAKECFVRHKDGYDVPVIKNARLAKDDRGRILGIVETITDLTELSLAQKTAEDARRQLQQAFRLGNIIGKSPAMQNVFDAVRAAADSRATVLIQGESGTGKELVAKAIHFNASKDQRPLVTVNCSALSETLLESELFGHVKGAFTGAHKDHMGRFEQADTGTIFLDEIGELTSYMQVKLLRVLQEREIERVGDTKKRKIDIRIIAATNKDLTDLTRKGAFREDLFYRLKVFTIQIPPLRNRKADIPLLVENFVHKTGKRENKRIKGVSPGAMKILMSHAWHGNVRELENAIEHAFVVCRTDYIAQTDLPMELQAAAKHAGVTAMYPASADPVPKNLTREALVDLLTQCQWNKAEVARRIGKSRTLVWKFMKKWDIPLKQP